MRTKSRTIRQLNALLETWVKVRHSGGTTEGYVVGHSKENKAHRGEATIKLVVPNRKEEISSIVESAIV